MVIHDVAGSPTWSDVSFGSGFEAMTGSVASSCAGSSVPAGSGFPPAVGSGNCSIQQGDGWLGSESGCVIDGG